MIVNFTEISAMERYHWMTQAIIPRPIAWVLTGNDNGKYNLAPFSYFNAMSSAPPLLGVSFGVRPNGECKDTLRNIRRRPHFVVHIAAMPLLPTLNNSAASLPYGESEVAQLKLETIPLTDDFPLPKLADAPLAFACRLHQEVALGETQALVLGEVLYLSAQESVMCEDAKGRQCIDAKKVNPVARLSAGQYAGLSEIVVLPRPE